MHAQSLPYLIGAGCFQLRPDRPRRMGIPFMKRTDPAPVGESEANAVRSIRGKLHSRRGIMWITALLLILVIVMAVITMIPGYQEYQRKGKTVACATALDSARRQLAANFMLDGFVNGSDEDAKALVAAVMNGWDDLCPDGGTVYIVPRTDSELAWDVVCGLHCSDSKYRTRLNSDYVLDQLREALRVAQVNGEPFPESLKFTLHHKTHTAYLVDAPSGLKRGTRTTEGQEGIVAYYSVVGHSDFGADSGMKEGALWYFSYADEDHCANWSYHDSWTGDSYRNIS